MKIGSISSWLPFYGQLLRALDNAHSWDIRYVKGAFLHNYCTVLGLRE